MKTPSTPPGARPRWKGALVVAAVALLFGFGLPGINRLIPGAAVQPAGVTIPLGHGVSVVTPEGWALDAPKTKPGETLALVRDASSLVATTFAWEGTEVEMVERARLLFESTRRLHLNGTSEPFRTASGVVGTTSAIYGEHVDGRLWIGQLPGAKVGFAIRVRSVPGQGGGAVRDAVALLESLEIKHTQ